MNYIHHMENTLVKFANDQRVTPWHISLYLSLFQIWNSTHFKKEISIHRNELMHLSKIGSANTYSKCLKQLSDWKYIKYTPSKSRFTASKVHMYRFDTTRDTTSNTTPDTSCDTTSDTSSDNTSVPLVRPYTNNIKHIINYNKQYKTKEGEEKKSSPPLSKNKKDKSSFRKDELHSSDMSKKTSPTKRKKFVPPELKEVKTFFHENKSSYQVAEMFFNHFESNGWMVGGRSKMKNWKAAARNWISRNEQYQTQNQSPAQQRLHVNENKDYSEPL
ncbi:transcriptional regulator [Brumimicrobium aurantiacum]|uniref:Transcriptional regulator n=1 Tax=Brumimicrobium aurantiacum TaxID=1737063 RepID=A0A3E1EUK2_9FLAO|nr:transcriptional regulator [Brumimicrobium aurantiacum]